MKTKNIEVCDAVMINITCDYNDPVDIKCGGLATLGYEFYVSPDEDIINLESKIKGLIEKCERSFMGISHRIHKDFDVKNLWTLQEIEKCIKENGF